MLQKDAHGLRLRVFDLTNVKFSERKNKDFSKDLPDSNPLCLYSSYSGVQSSIVTFLVSRYTSEMYATPWTFLSRFFKTFSFSPFLSPFSSSDVQLSRFPLFSFVRGRRPREMLHVLRFIFSFAFSPSAYFGESFCISNSNSCKDSTCPTALRSFFDAARTVLMTFLVKFPLFPVALYLHKRSVRTNPERFVNCD